MRRPIWALFIGIVAALLAAALLWYATRWGLILGGDSASYADLARNLRLGNGPTLSGYGAFEPVPTAHFPPGYPAFLAVVGDGARLAHALLLGLTGALLAVAAWRVSRSMGVAACFALWVTTHPDAVLSFGSLMSEALFVPLVLAVILLATAGPRLTGLLTAVVLAATAAFVRHVGLFLALPLVAQALAPRPMLRRRILVLAAALVPAIYAAWRIGWLASRDALPDRVLVWHPPVWADVIETLHTFGQWLLPMGEGLVLTLQGLCFVGLFGVACWRVLKRRHRLTTLGGAAAVAAVGYVLFLVLSRTFADASMPLGGRLWLPFIPLAGLVILKAWPRQRASAALTLLLLAGLNLWETVPLARSLHVDGAGYASPAWVESPTLAYVDSLPAGVPVASNAADAIHLLLDQPATLLPQTRFRTVDRVNTRWRRQLRELAVDLREQNGVIVYFDAVDRDAYLVSEAQLRDKLVVEPIATFADGRAYRVLAVR